MREEGRGWCEICVRGVLWGVGSVSGASMDWQGERERRGTYECDSKESASLCFDRVEEDFIRDVRDPTRNTNAKLH